MEYRLHEFNNGLRLLHVPFASPIAHCCVYIGSGTRHEPEGKEGLAHLVEHLIFKKTKKRSTGQILSRLENVGADLNAYTTKEYTCLHASFLNGYLSRTLELFADIIINSTYPDDELLKEKDVILDEIASYADQPEEAIQDDFEAGVFRGHPLGRNILGTAESLQGISRQDVLSYVQNNFTARNIIIAVSGAYNINRVAALVERLFDGLPVGSAPVLTLAPGGLKREVCEVVKPINQAHVMMGTASYALGSEMRIPMLLLNNYLGGAGMSSVLNLKVREAYGIAYSIESSYHAFSDVGLFSIYFGTESVKVAKALKVIYRLLEQLLAQGITKHHLTITQQRFCGLIALGEENRMGTLIAVTKSYAELGRIDTLEEIFRQINSVTQGQIQEAIRQNLDYKNYNYLSFLPDNI